MEEETTHCEKCQEVLNGDDFVMVEDGVDFIEIGYNCHCGFEKRYLIIVKGGKKYSELVGTNYTDEKGTDRWGVNLK